MRHLEALLVALLIPLPAFAQAPALLPVQGLLTDADGVPIDGTRSVTFQLYDAEVGGTALFTETQPIDFATGLFTAYLGTVETLDLASFAGDRWLGVTIETDGEMPRIRLGTTPYAAFAQTCGDAATLGGVAVSDFAVSTTLSTPGTINAPSNPVDWSQLKNVPAALADGTDDGLDNAQVTSAAQAACYNTEAELTAVLNDNYSPPLTAASNITVNSVATAVVDLGGTAQWNNSNSNGVTEMNVFSHTSCDATTRGRVRVWRLEDIGNSVDLADALCFCQEYMDRTPATPVTTYRWVCLYPQSDGN